MIKLINGRGQLGKKLKYLESTKTNEEVYVYHTWNIDDKNKLAQEEEYKKFVKFVNLHKDDKIVFISTSSTKDNWYNFYKHKSESYLVLNTASGIVIRLPTLIGKGMFDKLKNDQVRPIGKFNLTTIEKAVEFIRAHAFKNSIVRIYTLPSEQVSASVVYSLIKLGLK